MMKKDGQSRPTKTVIESLVNIGNLAPKKTGSKVVLKKSLAGLGNLSTKKGGSGPQINTPSLSPPKDVANDGGTSDTPSVQNQSSPSSDSKK